MEAVFQRAERKIEILRHLNFCILRVGNLHSWYKRKGPCHVKLVPVLGGINEQNSKRLPCPQFRREDVVWHVEVEHLDGYHAPTDPRLQSVIDANVVAVDDWRQLCLDSNHLLRPPPVPENDVIRYRCDTAIEFALAFASFKPVYEGCRRSALAITEFLLDHPDVPIPVWLDPHATV